MAWSGPCAAQAAAPGNRRARACTGAPSHEDGDDGVPGLPGEDNCVHARKPREPSSATISTLYLGLYGFQGKSPVGNLIASLGPRSAGERAIRWDMRRRSHGEA